MKQYTKEAIERVMQGCQNDDSNSIVMASRIICKFIEGNADIDCDPVMKPIMKISLWRKFMRAYSRFIRTNPHAITTMSIYCFFSSIVNGEHKGIEETI